MRKRIVWIVGGIVVAAAVAVTAGTFVYLNFIKDDAPPPLSLEATPETTTTAAGHGGDPATASGPLAAGWKVVAGSQAGYRVKEVLFGQSADAVGRTDQVSGSMTISAADGADTVTAVELSVDMTSVTSDQGRRDNQFRGRIMETSQYPTATFELTQPIALGDVPGDTTPVDVKATGDLTLHGVTRSVDADLSARRNGTNIEVSGSIPITFADYSIPNPSFGPAQTEDHGLLELLVVFRPST